MSDTIAGTAVLVEEGGRPPFLWFLCVRENADRGPWVSHIPLRREQDPDDGYGWCLRERGGQLDCSPSVKLMEGPNSKEIFHNAGTWSVKFERWTEDPNAITKIRERVEELNRLIILNAVTPIYWLEPTDKTIRTPFSDGTGSREQTVYIDKRTDRLITLDQAEPGAMWNASWIAECMKPGEMTHLGLLHRDGHYPVVLLPNRSTWSIDSRCSNCTRPEEPHHCWCRHDNPRAGTIHVDKNPEPGQSTCKAGAGSIMAGGWHGFLHHGKIIPAGPQV